MIALLVGLFASLSSIDPAQAQEEAPRKGLLERMKERRAQRSRGTEETSSVAKVTPPGDYRRTLTHGGQTRRYRFHVPPKYDPSTPTPLVIALHGGGGDMDYMANDTYYGLASKSDKEGFVVAFPSGTSGFRSGKLATWNAGKCCARARDNNVDDVGFIREMIGQLAKQLNIDRARVFATGMSNGGMMSYRLACELASELKAIAPVAGTDGTVTCTPERPISVLHIHAKNDDRVLFEGGAGKKFRNEDMVSDFVSVPATVSKWVKQNECSETPKRVLEKPGAYCDLYSGCKNGTEVKLCVTETGGHSWPGGVKPRGDERPSNAISANDMMWDFFKSK